MTGRRASRALRGDRCAPAIVDGVRKLDPRHMVRNPVMFVVEIGAADHDGRLADPGRRRRAARRRRRARLVHRRRRGLAVADRASSRNLAEALAEGRGKAQAAALRAMRTETVARLRDGGERRRAASSSRGDVVVVEAGEVIPGDGDRDRGHRLRRRVGDHRRVRAGDPRGRRRPLRGHRRHPGALRPDRGRDHPGARRVVPRPDDRARRGRERRKTPNEIALDILLAGLTLDLPGRGRHPAAVRRVRRHRRLDRRP